MKTVVRRASPRLATAAITLNGRRPQPPRALLPPLSQRAGEGMAAATATLGKQGQGQGHAAWVILAGPPEQTANSFILPATNSSKQASLLLTGLARLRGLRPGHARALPAHVRWTLLGGM